MYIIIIYYVFKPMKQSRTSQNVKIFSRSPVALFENMGLVARKPVFGVSDKASFKPVSLATETS